MTRVSSLILLTAAALALASPALAKVDLNKGVSLCKAELEKQSPPPKSMRTTRSMPARSATTSSTPSR